jgi:hypothetical protein
MPSMGRFDAGRGERPRRHEERVETEIDRNRVGERLGATLVGGEQDDGSRCAPGDQLGGVGRIDLDGEHHPCGDCDRHDDGAMARKKRSTASPTPPVRATLRIRLNHRV